MGFISYVSSAFSSTKFISSVGQSASQLGVNAAFHYTHYANRDGQLKFISPRGYSSVIVYAAKRTMMQLAFAKINDLYPSYVRQLDNKRLTAAYAKNQGAQLQQIICNNTDVDESLTYQWGAQINYMGKPHPEGLLLWIPNDSGSVKSIKIQTYWDKIKGLSHEEAAYANNVIDTEVRVPADDDKVFIDLGANIQVQSGNNVILTKVQGRDHSRKELISGGDMNFTVTGKIMSNYPDVYPYNMVSRFITLMQHKGVLYVSNLMFGQFHVSQIIIKDFQMGQNEGFKNVQPYSFTCVGVEPDEAVEVVKDTIQSTNLNIAQMKKKGWTTKLLEQVKTAAANQAAQMVEQLTSKVI